MARMQMTLKVKLFLTLALCALLPMVVAYPVGLKVIFDYLDAAMKKRSRDTADIARNVLLRQVQQIGVKADRIASDPELARLLAEDRAGVERHLNAAREWAASGLLEVFAPDRKVAGRVGRGGKLGVRPGGRAVALALDYERHLTLERVGDGLVVRASSPVVDQAFQVRGAVVLSAPLDEGMAEFVKGVVRAEVGFIAGERSVASTFLDAAGKRAQGGASADLVGQVKARDIAYQEQKIGGKHYGVSFAALQSGKGQYVGMVFVGLSLEQLRQTVSSASGYLALGAAGGLLLAWLFAYLLGRRISNPLARLHRSARAIAAGDLDQDVSAETDDEIGDLARAFQSMTVSLRKHNDALQMHKVNLEREVKRRTSDLEVANRQLKELARTDGLTGLYNHRYLRDALVKEVERSTRSKLPLSMLMIDVDNFKHYNDLNGHQAGDEVLRAMGELLTGGRRINDVVARYGGEEFAILLTDTPKAAASTLARQILRKVEQEEMHNEKAQPGGKLTISVGVATCPDDAGKPRTLVAMADAALYRAKRDGRNRVRLYDDELDEEAMAQKEELT